MNILSTPLPLLQPNKVDTYIRAFYRKYPYSMVSCPTKCAVFSNGKILSNLWERDPLPLEKIAVHIIFVSNLDSNRTGCLFQKYPDRAFRIVNYFKGS